MSFIVILIALSLQYFLKLYSAPYQVLWVAPYFKLMQKHFDALTKGHGLFGVLIFVLPLVIVLSLIFTFTYHVLGYAGYLILSLALLWYCLNLQVLDHQDNNQGSLFLSSYHSIFALLFWYFIFGPVGLALYVIVEKLHDYLQDQAELYPDLFKYAVLSLGVFDWVPIRLMGLSFALVGHFGAVFKDWVKVLLQGIATNREHIVTWGKAALVGDEDASGVSQLIFRALLVWLVAMALVSLGLWFG